MACGQRETGALGGLPPRSPQLGERWAGSRAGEAGHAGRKTIKVQFSSLQPSTETSFEDLEAGWLGGGGERFCVLFLSYVPPPPHPNILFGHKITNPRFSNPSLSFLGTCSLINDISTQIFNAQIDPRAHPPASNRSTQRHTLPRTRGAAPQ